jgi:hypothetical protein
LTAEQFAYLVGVGWGTVFAVAMSAARQEWREIRARLPGVRVGLDEADALDGIGRHPPAGARYACRAWGCTRCGRDGDPERPRAPGASQDLPGAS